MTAAREEAFLKEANFGATGPELLSAIVDGMAKATLPAVYRRIAALYEHDVGYRLMTISAIDIHAPTPVSRLWSSNETVYPVGGAKSLGSAAWQRTVLEQLGTMVCDGEAELAGTFADHAVLRELGCEAGINVPMVLAGQVIGSVNLFNEGGWFTPKRVERAKQLSAWVYAPLLAGHRLQSGEAGGRA